jgi:hypothetical protein
MSIENINNSIEKATEEILKEEKEQGFIFNMRIVEIALNNDLVEYDLFKMLLNEIEITSTHKRKELYDLWNAVRFRK